MSETTPLPDHLYTRGLLGGRHSDITVHAFGFPYRLHRLILDRAGFFESALSGPWLESESRDITLHPEDVDPNITHTAFELALKRLYGASAPEEEASEAVGLFATGCWLEMPDLIDSSIEAILRQMSTSSLTPLMKLVTSNYYGRAGDKILASAKAMLCRDGWKMPLKYWNGIPGDIVREIVGGDGFFIDGEWDRWVLAKRILDRRLRTAAIEAGLVEPNSRNKIIKAPDVANLMAVRFDTVYRKNSMSASGGTPDSLHRWVALYTHPDIEPLLVLLDEGIHYIHLDFEQLQYIRNARDALGLPILPEKVVSSALWMQMELRQKVVNAKETDMELGLSQRAEESTLQSPVARDTTMTIPDPPNKGKQKATAGSAIIDDDEDDIPSNSWDGNGKPRKFWIPSADCNIVMGGNADPVIATSAASAAAQRHASRLSATIQPEDVQWASDFAINMSDTRPITPMIRPGSAAGSNTTEIRPVAYSHVPPFRFAAEFPNPRLLKEKKRVYSRTVFYAGSLWNIYIQKVRSSKNPQLGVYLHRAKERDAEEVIAGTAGLAQGSVDERIGLLEREMLLRADRRAAERRNLVTRLRDGDGDAELEAGDSSGSADPDATLVNDAHATRAAVRGILGSADYRKSSQTDMLSNSPPDTRSQTRAGASNNFDDDDDEDGDGDPEMEKLSRNYHVPTLPPYVDARPTIRTYFKIYSPSKGGRMLSVYESAPDRFNFSQSWGWKSSTLMLDEGMFSDDGGDRGEEGAEAVVGEGGKRREGNRLRFMVVIGNI